LKYIIIFSINPTNRFYSFRKRDFLSTNRYHRSR